MQPRQGFTVIELLVLIVLVAVMAAIAIPNLLEARKSGNEAAAIGSLKTLGSAQTIFRSTDADGDSIDDYGTLPELLAAELIDQVLGSGTKQGYGFHATPGMGPVGPTWSGNADPAIPDTGTRHFFTDETGVIRFDDSEPAGASDPDIATAPPSPTTPEQEANAAEREQAAAQAIQGMDALAPAALISQAIQLLDDPTAMGTVLAELDANRDGALVFDEVLAADLLALARTLVPALVGSDPGPAIGDDSTVVALLDTYQQFLENQLELDLWKEDPIPSPELSTLEGDPQGFLATLLAAIPMISTPGRVAILVSIALAALAIGATALGRRPGRRVRPS